MTERDCAGVAKNNSEFTRLLFSTAPLHVILKKFEETYPTLPFHLYLQRLLLEKGMVCEHVIKNCGIDRTYGHQLFNGRRQPSRDKVIQLAFGFGLNVSQAQDLMRAAGKSDLYPKIKRDAVILFCLNNGVGFLEAQALLQELSLPLLGKEGRYE